jgi:hypothetical protein
MMTGFADEVALKAGKTSEIQEIELPLRQENEINPGKYKYFTLLLPEV